MNALTIGNSAIRVIDNLFSLNDLHKAAGNERKHLPAEFLRIDQTKALITEIGKYGDSHISTKVVRGAKGGTYACKELVYAYAMWISAAFMLQVIRAYDAITTMPPALAVQYINPAQQRAIQEAVNAYVLAHGTTHKAVYHSIKTKFKVAKYDQLPAAQYAECVDYLGGKARPTIEAQPKSANFLEDLPRQIAASNGYPLEVLMPTYRAIKARLDENALSAVDNSKSIYTRRWMGYFDGNGKEQVHFLDQNAYVFTAGQFARSMAQGVFSKPEVEDIVFRGHQFLMGDSQQRLDEAKPKTRSFANQFKDLHPLELLEIAKDAHMQAFLSAPRPQAVGA